MEYSKTYYTIWLYRDQPYLGSNMNIDKLIFDNYEDAKKHKMMPYHWLKEIQSIQESLRKPSKKNPKPAKEVSKSIVDRVFGISRIPGRRCLGVCNNNICEINFVDNVYGYYSISLNNQQILKAIICLRSLNLGLTLVPKQRVIWIYNTNKLNEALTILEKNGLGGIKYFSNE